MSRECNCGNKDAWKFPKNIYNRPGLDSLEYRIARYSDFHRALLEKLDSDPVLTEWTYRKADDPGIALLEGASILGDILTFYQEIYAREAYLRTAQWHESITELVRLLGYRLSPGIGGRAVFAFEVEGEGPVTIPRGFPVQVQLETGEDPADFEVEKKITAYPGLSRFHLYRPLFINPKPGRKIREFFIDTFSASGISIEPGDRFIVGDRNNEPEDFKIDNPEIVVVDTVREFHGVTVFTLKGALQKQHTRDYCIGFKLGRTFNHCGHNAPDKRVVDTDPASLSSISYIRNINADTSNNTSNPSVYVKPPIMENLFPLDREVDDLQPGTVFIWQWSGKYESEYAVPLAVYRTITSVRKGTYTWGSLTSGVTVASFSGDDDNDWKTFKDKVKTIDIRTLQFHEAVSQCVNIRAVPGTRDPRVHNKLYYFGSREEAFALKGRDILMEYEHGETLQYRVKGVATIKKATGSEEESVFAKEAHGWRITLDKEVDYSHFPHEKEKTIVYGNLGIGATQGKTVKDVVLGNGDSRQSFQSFKLPRKPLTFLIDTAHTPPEVPEVDIFVNQRQWKWVDSFFNRGPGEEVYIIRRDEEGFSWVQFGDGKTGARLPSGIKNVSARYRTGTGAYGSIKKGTTVDPGARVDNLKAVFMPSPVTGGAEPETGENARIAAPGKVQSLGRLVSLGDYEYEAMALPGVVKAKARWGLPDKTSRYPVLLLSILMDHDRDTESYTLVEKIMNEYNTTRGAERFPVKVIPGAYTSVYINLIAGYDPRYTKGRLKRIIRMALGVSGNEAAGLDGKKGLFGIYDRRFGEPEYGTRIQSEVQHCEGIHWVKVKEMGIVIKDKETGKETNDVKTIELSCGSSELLTLDTGDLSINLVKSTGKEAG